MRALLAAAVTLGLGAGLAIRDFNEQDRDLRVLKGAEVSAVLSSTAATLNLATKDISAYLDAIAPAAAASSAAECEKAVNVMPRLTPTLSTIIQVTVVQDGRVLCESGTESLRRFTSGGQLPEWASHANDQLMLQSAGPIERSASGEWTVMLLRRGRTPSSLLVATLTLSRLNTLVFDGTAADMLITVTDSDGRTVLRSQNLDSRAGLTVPMSTRVEGVSHTPFGLPFTRNPNGTISIIMQEPVISPDSSGLNRIWDGRVVNNIPWIIYAGLPYRQQSLTEAAASASWTVLSLLLLCTVLLWLLYSLTQQVDAVRTYVSQVSNSGNMLPPARLATEFAPLIIGFRKAFDLRKRAELQLEQINTQLMQRVEIKIAEIRRSEAFRDAVMETANDVVLVVNEQDMIVAANSGVESILGFSRTEIVGRTVAETIVPPEFHLAHQEAFSKRFGQVGHFSGRRVEFPVLRKDGSTIPAELSVSTTRVGDQVFAVGFLRDISAQEQQERALRDALQAASAAARAKSEFLAAMSHEIRTPLNGIMGMLDLVLDEPDGSSRKDRLVVARKSAQTLLHLLNSILDYSRLDAGRIELANETFDPRSVVQEVTDLARDLARMKPIDVACDVAPDLESRYVGDATRLRQVLLNLASNAVKFTDHGRIRLSLERASTGIRVSVQDTGIGIPADRMQAIFEPFTQADSSMTRRFGGSGLGLAIARSMAALMGGTIAAVSEPGTGSTFTLDLPLPAAAPVDELTAARRATRPVRAARILVVDDDPVSQLVASDTLDRVGHHCVTSSTGEQVVSLVRDESIDLVLMDCRMPVIDGQTATRHLRQAGFQGPIIAVTAEASEHERLTCLNAGMDDFLTKPVSPAKLVDIVAKWLASSRAA